MNNSWDMIVDFTILSFLLFIGSILKARISVLRKLILPTSMVAGFLGLLLGPEVLGWLPIDMDILGDFVYHLMGIGFIALSLKERDVKKSPDLVNSGMLIVSTYLIQGIVGFGLLLILVKAAYPNMFPGIGLLLPLGYGQGPGQAYSIGNQWEQLGVKGGGNLGLTVAGFGFIWATFVGVIFINYLVRSKRFKKEHLKTQKEHSNIVEESAPDEIPLSDAIDRLTYQGAVIGFIYLITYFTLFGLERLLMPLGTYGETLAKLLIGFHFLIGSLYAMLFRYVLNRLERAGLKLEHSTNNYLLQRISGFSFDYMIAASISAISIYALREYLIPILLLTTIGGIITIIFLLWLVPFFCENLSRIYRQWCFRSHWHHRHLLAFGIW